MPLPRLLLALAAAGLVLFALPARAVDVPRQMTFQGRLVRADGSPETAAQDLRFALYATSAGGAPLWEETHPTTPVSNGYYAVVLGSKVPLPANVLNGQALYLGVSLVGQSELTPRLPVVSVPYALRADDSNRLEGRAANTFANASHSHASVPYADSAGTATTATNSSQLQGNAASYFATATHTHTSVPYADAAGTATTATTATNSNQLQGNAASYFATATHNHDTVYSNINHTHPVATGTINGFVTPAERTKLGALLAVYTAGTGLGFNSTTNTLSVNFASGGTSGTATTAARSDHTHPSPSLMCTYKTATATAPAMSSTAYCATTEMLTGGGCMDLGASAAGAGSSSFPTGVTTVDGSTNTGGPGYVCRQPNTGGPFIAPTAYAICCRIP